MSTYSPRGGIEDDHDVSAALHWLARASGDPIAFWGRLARAQEIYRGLTSAAGALGNDFDFTEIGDDVPAAFLAQGKSLLDDRRSCDFALASRTIPWIKQVGVNVAALGVVPGASERARRMLQELTVSPESALFELGMAGNYCAHGLDAAFIDELKGGVRTPDLHVSPRGTNSRIPVEFKRLRRGEYEIAERLRQRSLFRAVADVIDARGLSIHIDVTYTEELEIIPESYLADRLMQALSSPIATPDGYPWKDQFGYGVIRAADVDAVRHDIADSSLYFGTKMARLLVGHEVRESGYHLVAGAEPDPRDPRYIQSIAYGSVITWESASATAIDKKARYIKSKLAEAERQLYARGPGILHVAMDVEPHSNSSDLRRSRNIDAIASFKSSAFLALYVHYLVPRISEEHAWLIDETVDRFGAGADVPSLKIFQQSKTLANDLPAWKQELRTGPR